MAVKKGECYYKVLRGLIRDCKYGQIEPVLTTYVKKHGIVGGSVGKMLVHYLCMKNNVNSAIRLVSKLKEDNFSVSFPADVLTVLTRRGRVLDAYRLVVGAEDNLPILDVVDYAVVIDGLCKRGYIERALSLCGFARKKGIELNVVMYNSILNGLCFHSCLVEAFRLFDSLERNNIVPSVVTYGTLIDALVREGFLLDAREMFDRMILKGIKLNTHIYNSLIEGYCRFGNVQEALKLLNDLEVISLKPDEFTISAVIDGLCREGDLEEALHFFVHAKRKGISPDFLGFLYLVRGLCSKGRMEEARSILRLMLQTDSVVELINRVDIEIETESVENFLVHLCEQGSIQEAVIILSEIGSLFFPCKKQAAYSRKRQAPNLALGITDVMGVEQEVECCHPSGQGSRPHDFDAFYLQLASLCSAGDLQAASELAKETISLLDKN